MPSVPQGTRDKAVRQQFQLRLGHASALLKHDLPHDLQG
jgi:hypothetical protein